MKESKLLGFFQNDKRCIYMTNVDSKLESAARLERSSFFVTEKAVAKIAGVEGGNSCHKK
ncbi:hypothetical protein IO89_11265 [Epilithonimonas lactis]|uniref:Uncharacterized protein n=1 Tax=Epilithonimonas lactis TaxID=421072 RepID=A0A085BEC1_9FLAO|nr:hypothetical protein IO89_11265 [Epilithonimonas lactis]